MADISLQLLEAVKGYIADHKHLLVTYIDKLASGNATYLDADDYAIALSEITKKAFNINITGEVLPNGKMYYNIANKIIPPIFQDNFQDINSYCETVQQIFNKEMGLTFNPVVVKYDRDREEGLIDYVSNAEKYEDVRKSFENNIINFNQYVVTENQRQNMDFQYKTGAVKPLLVRSSTGYCCKWCQARLGTFEYAPDMSSDYFRRHANCTCKIHIIKEKGKLEKVPDMPRKDSPTLERKEISKKLKEDMISDGAALKERQQIYYKNNDISLAARLRNEHREVSVNG